MQVSNQWPLSIISRAMLASGIGRFLRTHRQGEKLLHEFMASTPADRTEAEYELERRQADEARQAEAQRQLAAHNEGRAAGLPSIEVTLGEPTGD